MARDELFSITGKAHWAFVQSPDRKFVGSGDDDPQLGGHYKINVEIDADAEKELLDRGLGHLIKFQPPTTDERDPTETGYKYVAVKRRENYKKDGEYFAVKKPKVVNSGGAEIDDLIGNGSVVEVLMKTYFSPKMKKKYVNLLKTTVIDLVEYTPPEEKEGEAKAEGSTGEVVE